MLRNALLTVEALTETALLVAEKNLMKSLFFNNCYGFQDSAFVACTQSLLVEALLPGYETHAYEKDFKHFDRFL